MPEFDKYAKAFKGMTSVDELTRLLDIDYAKGLVYHLYRRSEESRYVEFDIRKRNGNGTRRISAPTTGVKLIQSRLNFILSHVYEPKRCVNGFVTGRSILTNATGHVGKRYVFNIDLKNFFESINFGRVRGMFMAKPYGLPPPIATILAQICCHKNALPQGAPTSPVVSNMVCSRMDSQLHKLAKEHACFYTRYADNITLSTNRREFPSAIGDAVRIEGVECLVVGDSLRNIIQSNGFEINSSKTRIASRSKRQEVTGITTNEFPNVDRKFIRNIRAVLHALRTYGLEKTQEEYEKRYNLKSRYCEKDVPRIEAVLRGKIQHVGFVRGKDSGVYRDFSRQFNLLGYRKSINLVEELPVDRKLNLSCWVIESDYSFIQGTAFFLKDVGLVTCAHCVGREPFIRHPSDVSREMPLEIVCKHDELDLAILRPKDNSFEFYELSRSIYTKGITIYTKGITIGHKIKLLGYPHYAPGKTISVRNGAIVSRQNRSGMEKFHIDAQIICGNSGGPVLSEGHGAVLGVAVTGTDSEEVDAEAKDENKHPVEYGVIPISAIDHLLSK